VRFILFLLILIFSFNPFIYSNNCYPITKKEKRIVKKLKSYLIKENYYDAKRLLSTLEKLPIYESFKAQILWRNDDKMASKILANNIIDICPESFPNLYYILAEMAYLDHDYVLSTKYLRKSIDLGLKGDNYINAIKFLPLSNEKSTIISNPVKFNPKVVEGISTNYDEYLPTISPDQDYAFFTRRFLSADIDRITSKYEEKFISSTIVDGTYSFGFPLKYPFNVESNEGGASITIANDILYFTKCKKDNQNYNNCDIFYSIRERGEWSEVLSFNENISSKDSWESQPSVSSNGLTIVFASDRKGGFGGIDLYEINKLPLGDWSEPVNLGENINSNYNEKSPFLHTDGQTLYFSSNNHPSVGGYDIFYSRKDSAGKWGVPKNIGYPINSSFDEISLFVSTDGNKAYFASNSLNGIGGWDIYSFDLHDNAKPKKVLFLKGSINDSIDTELEIRSTKTNNISTFKISGGKYAAALTISDDEDFVVTVKKKGYSFNSTFIFSDDSTFQSPSELNFNLEKISSGSSFLIKDINFDLDSYHVNEQTSQILYEFANYLKLNSDLTISINGYTDSIGNSNYNLKLSENRAKSVYEKILLLGIAKERLQFQGYGEKNLKFRKDASKFKLNRRTEFEIISD
jgi:outer membrane protein OmpA-like peptidoglycan-associated protein